ncbi:MerR family transcriptional regulator [Herbiconiux ginsengi]|uniref:Transcriptional regulator, MerR family n=1 Tax=Herbiconiux ginsengi TaxID=381665 RepID=A0A1H3S3L4_9MICO|nr:MerR family transcriptional regulator [Herbiconiux ginsengi]SDZ32357.1 transcriptional regulator, MerR family [Herbiconiux ginsengi]
MRIKQLSEQVGVSTRLLRYYEEQGLLTPRREENGYRSYDDDAVARVQQIRGLLDVGLTTEIIREVLPCLAEAACSKYDDPEFVARIARERDRLRERVSLLSHNLKALDEYLTSVGGKRPTEAAA